MCRILSFVFLCIFCSLLQLNGQIFPREGSRLNYRIIGFSFPNEQQVSKYRIEIATGDYDSETSFENNIVSTVYSEKNKVIIEIPAFGARYTWRTISINNNSSEVKSPLYHFSTMVIPEVDTNVTHLRIIKSAETYKDAYVFVDGTRALYNMNGNPVWFLPDIDSLITNDCFPRDMKLTPQGTITILIHKGIYELDYNAGILWKMPKDHKSEDSIEFYHHEFTRLANGHYLVLGDEKFSWTRPNSGDSNFTLVKSDAPNLGQNPNGTKMSFGTIIEYDRKGRVVWSWKSSDYFKKSDIYFHKAPGGFTDVHENAFFFDEKTKSIYLSFKGINRILKVKYPNGTVSNAYGEIYKPNIQETGNDLFCGQHSCRISDDGYLYLFNNNDCHPGKTPIIIMMQEPVDNNNSLKKIWEYECDIAHTEVDKQKPYTFAIGGNVLELPDQSFLVSISGTFTNIFIVNRNKKILWNAALEKWNAEEEKWMPILNYKASMITDQKNLEQLIWNAEK